MPFHPSGRWTGRSGRLSLVDYSGVSRGEVLQRTGIAQSCMNLLEKWIWKFTIRLDTKIRRYRGYVVPVLTHGCNTWATAKYPCAIDSMLLTLGPSARYCASSRMSVILLKQRQGYLIYLWLSASVSDGDGTKAASLWSQCSSLFKWKPPLCHRGSNPENIIRLEATARKTQPFLA